VWKAFVKLRATLPFANGFYRFICRHC
jgi:hypothetical protein